MATPFDDYFLMNKSKLQLTNRKNKYTINYNNVDDIEEEIYRMKQRKFLKNRSEFYKEQIVQPTLGSIIKIYSINYLVESYNPLNGKHTLINTENFKRRYFDLQLYSWKYVPKDIVNEFKMLPTVKPSVKSNHLVIDPLPPIRTLNKVKLFDIKASNMNKPNPLLIENKIQPANINGFNKSLVIDTKLTPLEIIPYRPVVPDVPKSSSILPMPNFSETVFDIESQTFVCEKPNLKIDTIIESDLELEDISDSESDESENSNRDLSIGNYVEDNYFKIENINNWHKNLSINSNPLIVIHGNDSTEIAKEMIDDIVEFIEKEDEEIKIDEEKEDKIVTEDKESNKDEGGYCTIM